MFTEASAVGEEGAKLISMPDETFSLVSMDTTSLGHHMHSNGPIGGYSPPSDGEGIGQVTSDEEL